MVSLNRPLPLSAIPGLENQGANGVSCLAECNTRPRWSLALEYTCVRGWVARKRLTVRVAPPALREGHPTSAISAKYTCIREGK